MFVTKSAYLFISLATIFAVQGALAANSSSTAKQVVASYTRPLSFEPNRGQADSPIDFLARGIAYDLSLSHAEAVITLQRGPAKGGSHMDTASIRMSPIGVSGSLAAEPLDQQPSKSNYFLGNVPAKWHTNIANYAKVRYRDVYPGIDLIYYGNQRQLEYDFVISPGADPAHILLGFEGAAKAALDDKGDLVVNTTAGDLRWQKPVAYQDVNGSRHLVACSYMRNRDGRLGFSIAAYDHAKPLIIDPILVYSTLLGALREPSFSLARTESLGSAIAVDSHGNAYVTGSTSSQSFPSTSNAFQMLSARSVSTVGSFPFYSSNAFITKFDAAGTLVYSTYLGGCGCIPGDTGPDPQISSGDAGRAIAVDADANVYVAGITQSLDFPVNNAFQGSNGNWSRGNAFVTKLSADGSELVYSTYLGGSITSDACFKAGGNCADQANGIAVGRDGAAYVTGSAISTDFPTMNPFQAQLKGITDAFVAKLDGVGTLIYSTYLGGSGNDQGNGVATDAYGNAYVAGSTSSTDFPMMNAFQPENKSCGTQPFPGCQNAFVTKLDAAGIALVYSTYLGGSGQHCNQFINCTGTGDSANGITVDVHGNAYLVGTTTSSNFPVRKAFQPTLKATCPLCGNAFVTKFDPAGCALLYSTYLGGSGGDSGAAIALDKRKNAYVTGQTSSADFPIKNAFQSTLLRSEEEIAGGAPGGDAFVTEIDAADRGLVYSTYLGGADAGAGIAVDRFGEAYVTGVVENSLFHAPIFPLKNAFQSTVAISDRTAAFVTKFSRQLGQRGHCAREH